MAWYYGTKVIALYTTRHDTNSWAYFSGGGISGWRKFKEDSDDAHINMTTLCVQAKSSNSFVDIEVDGSDQVITIYVW